MAEALSEALAGAQLEGGVLLAGFGTAIMPEAIARLGATATRWSRRCEPGIPNAAPWPPEGPHGAAALRLPKSRAELDMAMHAIAATVAPGGPIWICGANDEGIKSAGAHLAPLLGDVQTVAVKSHCRVLAARRPAAMPSLRGALADWRQAFTIDLGKGLRSWVSYPGLFAHGRIDEGTQLLIDNLPPLRPKASVLDFGCGTGILAAAALSTSSDLDLTLLDSDSVALEAARENVPGALFVLAGDTSKLQGRFDAILSNPPLHDGHGEDHKAFQALIEACPRLLRPDAILQVVVQGRVGALRRLEQGFASVAEIARTSRYVVLRAHAPKVVVRRSTL
jgi:16S rRNA (guanine1207-N2)-methyltransferase